MQNILKRGGKRRGRPKGSGRYGGPTVPVRVPVILVGEVKSFIRYAPRKLPLFVVGEPSEKPGQPVGWVERSDTHQPWLRR
jgi:hypothetical protein